MATELFYRIGTEEIGPVNAIQIRSLVKEGKIVRSTLLRKSDSETWIEAGKVKGLFDKPETNRSDAETTHSEEEETVDPLLSLTTRAASTLASAAGSAASTIGGAASNWLARRKEKKAELAKAAESPSPLPAWIADERQLPSPIEAPQPVAPTSYPQIEPVATTSCPFCAEPINPQAKKCKHCGEIIDVVLRTAYQAHVSPQPVQAIPVINISNVNTATAKSVAVSRGRGRKRWSRIVAFLLSCLTPGLGQLYKGQLVSAIVWFIVVLIGYFLFIVPGFILHWCCAIAAACGDPYE